MIPPGQWATVPGRSQYPQTPTVGAFSILTVRSVPAADVTRIVLAVRVNLTASLMRGVNSGSGNRRSNASGCSLEIIKKRAPSLIIAGSSGAWSIPSTVRSTTIPLAASALTTGPNCWTEFEAPVERTGTGAT